MPKVYTKLWGFFYWFIKVHTCREEMHTNMYRDIVQRVNKQRNLFLLKWNVNILLWKIFNSFWMKLSMMLNNVQTEVNWISTETKLSGIALTAVWLKKFCGSLFCLITHWTDSLTLLVFFFVFILDYLGRVKHLKISKKIPPKYLFYLQLSHKDNYVIYK